MNFALIFKLIGSLLKIEAVFMVIPLIVSYLYGGDDKRAFLWTALMLLAIGFALSMIKPENKNFRARDAFAATSLSWFVFSFFGAFPYYFSGYFESFTDCFFESVSGFTTTGATILNNVELLPMGLGFWRCFTQWLGGMGVLVFMLAVMPSMNASSVNLLKAEATGPAVAKFAPKVRETARKMYYIYVAMTAILILLLVFSGIPVYDALLNAFSTAGTGGFSNMNLNIGAYGNFTAEMIILVFMLLFGVSFVLYYYIYTKNLAQVFNDEELKLYIAIVAASTAIIAVNLTGFYGSVTSALRHASFQVASVITTTCFSTADYSQWPSLSQIILLLLMITGCCAGSTGGGIKLIRVLILIKAAKIEINKIIHPRSVKIITVSGRKIENDIIKRVALFFFMYIAVSIISSILVSIDGFDIVTSVTAVVAMLGNSGPGLGLVGPAGNYGGFSEFSKLVLSFCMLAGRLELYPVLILLVPSVWKEKEGV